MVKKISFCGFSLVFDLSDLSWVNVSCQRESDSVSLGFDMYSILKERLLDNLGSMDWYLRDGAKYKTLLVLSDPHTILVYRDLGCHVYELAFVSREGLCSVIGEIDLNEHREFVAFVEQL